MNLRHVVLFMTLTGVCLACATSNDVERLEAKLNRLIEATNRSALEDIFGPQAIEISKHIDQLDEQQRQQFENLAQSYTQGSMALSDVRGRMLNIIGNNDRVVSTQRGLYIRNIKGDKIKALSNGTMLNNCRPLLPDEIPISIKEHPTLKMISWGGGQFQNEWIIFPWELTMSTFTKEIVENTARRTAQEFIRMGEEKRMKRPIYIQLTTDSKEQIGISTPADDSEVFVESEKNIEQVESKQ